ncbi:Protein of unknown function [Franzmannia pantelleriensis]|uniref:DUF2909 domain-containing protein n=1 Tax=Franzmannia pantelleriensis TaxID=48727 RepID=A0A1G9FBY8_9GAMM|nr:MULTISPECIES: DUF2909 family protein [Halomonas]APX93150.1 hypothetical protein BWR19_09520 [Halomonas sp. 1513]SDK85902.1 Protein of unknown function [Halomonas pantelleriensis]
MLKALIALTFLTMLASLAAGAGFLLRDHGNSRRLLTSLKLRVSMAGLLILLLGYGFYIGDLA